jgi:hypothetical protein
VGEVVEPKEGVEGFFFGQFVSSFTQSHRCRALVLACPHTANAGVAPGWMVVSACRRLGVGWGHGSPKLACSRAAR